MFRTPPYGFWRCIASPCVSPLSVVLPTLEAALSTSCIQEGTKQHAANPLGNSIAAGVSGFAYP
jgi:hypothetical protein